MKRANEELFAGVSTARWRRCVFSYAVTIVLVAITAYFAWCHAQLFLSLVSIGLRWLPVVALMTGVSLVARAYFLQRLVRELGACVPARECFWLVAATDMLSMLTPPPSGGAYRAFYLYSRHGIEVLSFASGTALFVVMGVLVWCALAIVALMGSGLATENFSRPLLLVTLVSVTALIAAWQAKGLLQLMHRGGLTRVADWAGASLRIASSRRVAVAAAVAMLASVPTQIGGYFLILHLFGLAIGLSDSTSILAFHQLSGVIGLTPGGVGVQEGAGVIVAGGLGLDVAQMIVVFALIRAARIGMSILFGAPCWWMLPGSKATNGDGRHNLAAHNFVGQRLPKRVPD